MVSASRGGVLLSKRFRFRETPRRVRLPPLARIVGQYPSGGAPRRLAVIVFVTPRPWSVNEKSRKRTLNHRSREATSICTGRATDFTSGS